MNIKDLVLNLKTDHKVIEGILDDISQSSHDGTLKQLAVLERLLTNHFFVEEYFLYPRMKENFFKDETDDSIERYSSIGAFVIQEISEIRGSSEEDQREKMAHFISLLKDRIRFENEIFDHF